MGSSRIVCRTSIACVASTVGLLLIRYKVSSEMWWCSTEVNAFSVGTVYVY